MDQGLEKALAVQKILTKGSPTRIDPALGELAEMFREAARDVRKLVYPARAFLSTVLDRELTAAGSSANPGWDPAEMAFAAASYGFGERTRWNGGPAPCSTPSPC